MNQGLIESQMSAIANRSRMVNGVATSLCDLGYCDVGLDDNWQACSKYGPNGYSYHDANGRPVVNQQRFPDFIAMTTYAHSLGLTSGWYGNNCICSDHCTGPECYQGDVDAVMDYGFDSIKLDGCGGERDLTLYADLFNQTGKSILIENCHWGGTVPNATWCPWNYFRSSGDIRASYDAVVGNLQTTIQWAKSGLSQPGCWAYPDMLQVGCAHGPGGSNDPGLSDDEAAAHFGAWCVVSSPLVLSMDLTNATVMDKVWPLVTNTDALRVNQAWAGFSGSVFLSAPAETVVLRDAVAAEAPIPAWQAFNKPLSATEIAVFVMNHAATSATITIPFSAVPGLSSVNVNAYDVWAQKALGPVSNSWTVQLRSHQSAFVILTPQ